MTSMVRYLEAIRLSLKPVSSSVCLHKNSRFVPQGEAALQRGWPTLQDAATVGVGALKWVAEGVVGRIAERAARLVTRACYDMYT